MEADARLGLTSTTHVISLHAYTDKRQNALYFNHLQVGVPEATFPIQHSSNSANGRHSTINGAAGHSLTRRDVGWVAKVPRVVRQEMELLTVATMMLVVVATSAPTTMLADGTLARLTIVVDNRADVRPDVLTRAMMHVMRILGAIAVDTSWTRIPPQSPTGFIVHISIVPQLADWPSDRWTHPLGVAVKGDGGKDERIYVFYDQVDEFARGSSVKVDVVLGHVTAHEIGHILLPQTSHVESGIMGSPWDASDMESAANERLLFTAKQGALIRDHLRRCCSNTTTVATGT
jgi:hypothetical protein